MENIWWSWPVYWYLFLAGVGSGATAVSAFIYLRGAEGNFGARYFKLAKYGAMIGPLPVIVGTGFLIFELGRPFRAFNIMTSNFWYQFINPSPMNFGGWFLLLFGLISILYALSFLRWGEILKTEALARRLENWSGKWRGPLAGLCAPLSIATAIYTAVLLGAMPARPLWNSPVLWSLFTISALSTGIAAIMLANRFAYKSDGDAEQDQLFHNSGYWLTTSDILLIIFELVMIALFIMFAYMTAYNPRFAIQAILPGGELAIVFWTGLILFGLTLPLLIESYYVLRRIFTGGEFKPPLVVEVIVPITVLLGGFILRYVVVVGGQLTGPIGI